MALGELKNGIGPDAYAIYQQVLAAVVERDHPVGSLYISENATSPAELYGGTWERIEGKFIMGASDTYPARSTGGEAEHTLSIGEMPKHNHLYSAYNQSKRGVPYLTAGNTAWEQKITTNEAGEGKPHNNIPPYYSMYIWRRVA